MIIEKTSFYVKVMILGFLRKYFHFINFRNSTSIIRIDPKHRFVTKEVLLYKKYNVIENEIQWLKKLKKSKYTPDLISYNGNLIRMSYCGVNITKHNIPNNWNEQIDSIIKMLKKYNCSHNDIKPSDLLVLNEKIILIDFQWATKLNEKIPYEWPKSIGIKYKSSNNTFDDNQSIKKSIEHILIS